MRLSLSSIFIWLFAINLNTQNEIAFDWSRKENNLYLDYVNFSFFKNNEYFSPFQKGYTGIGSINQISFHYYLNSNCYVKTGAHFLKYSGVQGFTEILPLISVNCLLSPDLQMKFGHLNGNLDHGLNEILYLYDRSYQNNVENGIQFLFKKKRLSFDLWMDWETFIFHGDPYQEEFVVGYTSDLLILEQKVHKIIISLDAITTHKGGQIDISNAAKQTTLNTYLGIRHEMIFSEMHKFFIEYASLDYKGLHAPPPNDVNHLKFDNGWGRNIYIRHEYKQFAWQLGLWESRRFISPRGEYAYQSISRYDESFADESRYLIHGKVSFMNLERKIVHLELRGDIYHDLERKQMDYCYGIYIRLKSDFFLKKMSNAQD